MSNFRIHRNEDGETVLHKHVNIPGDGVAWETIASGESAIREISDAISHWRIKQAFEAAEANAKANIGEYHK